MCCVHVAHSCLYEFSNILLTYTHIRELRTLTMSIFLLFPLLFPLCCAAVYFFRILLFGCYPFSSDRYTLNLSQYTCRSWDIYMQRLGFVNCATMIDFWKARQCFWEPNFVFTHHLTWDLDVWSKTCIVASSAFCMHAHTTWHKIISGHRPDNDDVRQKEVHWNPIFIYQQFRAYSR